MFFQLHIEIVAELAFDHFIYERRTAAVVQFSQKRFSFFRRQAVKGLREGQCVHPEFDIMLVALVGEIAGQVDDITIRFHQQPPRGVNVIGQFLVSRQALSLPLPDRGRPLLCRPPADEEILPAPAGPSRPSRSGQPDLSLRRQFVNIIVLRAFFPDQPGGPAALRDLEIPAGREIMQPDGRMRVDHVGQEYLIDLERQHPAAHAEGQYLVGIILLQMDHAHDAQVAETVAQAQDVEFAVVIPANAGDIFLVVREPGRVELVRLDGQLRHPRGVLRPHQAYGRFHFQAGEEAGLVAVQVLEEVLPFLPVEIVPHLVGLLGGEKPGLEHRLQALEVGGAARDVQHRHFRQDMLDHAPFVA